MDSFFMFSPSSKTPLPSEEDLDHATLKSATSQTQTASLTACSTNSAVTTTTSSSKQAVNSKDDASIASGSSGCGSLTKKTKPQIVSGTNT